MPEIIDTFRGPYFFLSNFYYVPILLCDDITYPTSEHAFQAQKTLDMNERQRIANLATPREAKRAGRVSILRKGWDDVRIDVMREIVRIKFKEDPMRERLLDTGDARLVEGNTWGDKFWGVYDGVGENHLGRILMRVRKELQNG